MRTKVMKGAKITSLNDYRLNKTMKETFTVIIGGLKFTGKKKVVGKDFSRKYENAYKKLYYEGWTTNYNAKK